MIKTLMAVLPLLGLLGTVTGMVQVFDVMAITGTGNARLMAGGVSAATILLLNQQHYDSVPPVMEVLPVTVVVLVAMVMEAEMVLRRLLVLAPLVTPIMMTRLVSSPLLMGRRGTWKA